MRTLNLMASPGSIDMSLMAKDGIKLAKQNCKTWDTLYNQMEDIEFDNNYVITIDNLHSEFTRQCLIRAGWIRPVTESGFTNNEGEYAVGVYAMEPGCWGSEENRQAVAKTNLYNQWKVVYYDGFIDWFTKYGQNWKITSIFQLLFHNHFPAYTGDIITKHRKTRMFNYEAQAWRSKWKTNYNTLLLIDPDFKEPVAGIDQSVSSEVNFQWPGALDANTALDLADAFGNQLGDDIGAQDESLISKLFSKTSDDLTVEGLLQSKRNDSVKRMFAGLYQKGVNNIIY